MAPAAPRRARSPEREPHRLALLPAHLTALPSTLGTRPWPPRAWPCKECGTTAEQVQLRGSALPDVLARGLRVVFCGINPGRISAAAGAHFANPRNDFWRLLHAAGFTSRLLAPAEQFALLDEGLGVTNAAARTTRGSSELRSADFAGAAARLDLLARELQPRWIGFVGKEAYRGAFGNRPPLGEQPVRLGDTRVFVLPSTSPANAAVPWEERLRWFRALRALVDDPER